MDPLIVVILGLSYFACQFWAFLRPIRTGKAFTLLKAIKAFRLFRDDDEVVKEDPNVTKRILDDIQNHVDCHETAAVLHELIKKDGAGTWPPRAQYNLGAWPAALRPYKQIYMDMAPLIPQVQPSLDDDANLARVRSFRHLYKLKLQEHIDINQVKFLLAAADAGRWDVFPRDVYNAFYCCVASSRHAYRWATNPVVKATQLETQLDLPEELVAPWESMQRHFGCASDSGNNTSNLVLNFDTEGKYVFRSNTGMSERIMKAEETFARIFNETEIKGLPVYHDMMMATISWARHDKASAAHHVSRVEAQIRAVLNSYYDSLHDGKIAKNVWLSRVQGFYAWGIGHEDDSGDWARFDGLSGNQIPLFHALDAFLGLEPYLAERDRNRNVPALQRNVREAFQRHSFRNQVSEYSTDPNEVRIASDMDKIIKKIRLFRTTHRTRAKAYLSQPAPERLPMTAGKSLLKDDIETSLDFLDSFMVGRIRQTV